MNGKESANIIGSMTSDFLLMTCELVPGKGGVLVRCRLDEFLDFVGRVTSASQNHIADHMLETIKGMGKNADVKVSS